MGLLSKIFSNTRKPEGFFGKMMVNGMNGGGHAQMAHWALSSVQIKEDGQILDIGCGGGANIARLLQRVPKGMVQGIDYSSVSVAKSSKVNAKAIAEGRCKVQEASVVKLPFGENAFGLVTAFETIYFWPDIEHCFGEVKRVLKPRQRVGRLWPDGCQMGKPHRGNAHLQTRGNQAASVKCRLQGHRHPERRSQTLADGDSGEISMDTLVFNRVFHPQG